MRILRNFLDKIEPEFRKGGSLGSYQAIYEMLDTLFYSPSDVSRRAPHVRDAINLKRVMGLVVVGVLLVQTRHLLPRHVLAFVGTLLLALFLCVRMTSHHHVDAFTRTELLGVDVRWLLEMSGIACIGVCAMANAWWARWVSREVVDAAESILRE